MARCATAAAPMGLGRMQERSPIETVEAIRSPAISFLGKLNLSGGRPTGFDYLRIILAVGVICIHAPLTAYGTDLYVWSSGFRPLTRIILPMFFALSGYLVAGSLLRCKSVFQFLFLRVIRIYPALCVEVLLSALIIGPVFTTLPRQEYFQSATFFRYLLNATGDVHYFLPGLFQANPLPRVVNGQLWTVPFELLCYILFASLALVGMKRHRWIAPTAVAGLTAAYTILKFRHGFPPTILGRVSGLFLVTSFLSGASLFFYSELVIWSAWLCLGSGIVSFLLLSVVPNGDYLFVPFAAYFTVSLGLLNPKKIAVLRGADYSYGVFLYGFVIQQVLSLTISWARVWWLNIMLSIALSAVVAALSWHLVEKPALKLKRYVPDRITPRHLSELNFWRRFS